MLLSIREHASGVIAWIIVILLIVVFALWGVQEYIGAGRAPNVAEVNGVELTRTQFSQAYQNAVRSRENAPQGEAAKRLRKSVLDQMIDQQLLNMAAREAGMRISDGQLAAHIRSMEPFQEAGQFSSERYQQLLRANRMSEEGFESSTRQQLLRQQLAAGVLNTELVTEREFEELVRLRDRKVDLRYVVVPAQRFRGDVRVSDEEIQSYYDEHSSEFMTPEKVRLAYLKLDPKDIEGTIGVTQERLRQLYEEQKATFMRAEQRYAAHILVQVPEDASEAQVTAARQEAQDLYQRLLQGESFAALAKEYSDDPGSAEQGGSLGLVTRDSLDPEFEEALYNLDEVGDFSEPVRSSFGFHIVKLTDRKPGSRKSFEAVRDQLAREHRRSQAEDLFYERSELLFDLTYENPMTLEVAAAELGLDIQESDWITRQGASEGIGQYSRVVKAAFSSEVLAGGDPAESVNSQMIELRAGRSKRVNPVAVIRLKDHQPSQLQPLSEVRERIEGRLRQQKAEQMAEERAQALAEAARSGQSLSEIATDNGFDYTNAGLVERGAEGYSPALLSAAFEVGAPSGGQPAVGSVRLPAGDRAVFAVSDVQDGDPAEVPEQQRRFMDQFIANVRGNLEMEALLKLLREQADITVYESVLYREE